MYRLPHSSGAFIRIPLASGQKDVVFVHACVVDEDGELVHSAQSSVTSSVEGDAELIGRNPIDAKAGIATILLRAGNESGTITVQARSEGLKENQILAESQ